MKYVSTRQSSEPVNFSKAIVNGLAPDGGLYIPECLPKINPSEVSSPADVIRKFVQDDPLEEFIDEICKKALNFSAPVVELGGRLHVLELFHGPTNAFKDFGARFLANAFEKLANLDPNFKRTILVATSGDTGSAVASAFWGKKNFEVQILFPDSNVSDRQKHQLTCWDNNVRSFGIRENFDACQRTVKSRLKEMPLRYTSANSINIGRLLPQMTYFAMTSLRYPEINFIVPSGNMGNVLACFWAKETGFPINKIHISTNANKPLETFFNTGKYASQPTVETIANAMDVGNPSNVERFLHQFPDLDYLKSFTDAKSFSDFEIKQTILDVFEEYDYIACPHTATGIAFQKVIDGNWCVTATAHPAKFETVLEPLLNAKISIPSQLGEMLNRESNYQVLDHFNHF